MKILIACEESQRVCSAFREKGHESYSCDIIEPSGGHPEWHILGNALEIIRGDTVATMDGEIHDIGRWDMIIAHPPCTYLSNAGACRLYPRKGELNMDRYQKGLQAKEFFMSFYNFDCAKIAIENPIPSKVFDMPPYTQIIQPYEYGHPYTKKTCLWLKGLPQLKPTSIVNPTAPFLPSGTGRKIRSKYGVAQTKKERSKTFPGIAKAMSEQWG